MSIPFVPELFGDFLLVQRLSRSAMSEVLVAVRLGDRTGRTFVLKRPTLGERASGRSAQAILREGEVLAAVRASSLPALEARGELGGLPYVAIEHVRGATLDELLRAGDSLSEEAVRAVALDTARALAALHKAGFSHGDVTTSNVVVDDTGDGKLVDLGLARRIGEARDEVSGTAGYLAPEAVLPGEVKAASDVYGWAVVVAECALGRAVFPERDLASAANRGEIPRELSAWDERMPKLRAALSRDPSARPTAEELVRALEGMTIDRAALCERVEAHMRGEQPKLLTPTAPMVVPAKAAPEGSLRPTLIEEAPDKPKEERRSTAPHSAVPLRSVALLIVLGVALFAAGQVSARLGMRNARGSVSYAGALPKRATLEVDGQKEVMPADGRLSLPPGEHTIALVLPKGARREYTVRIRPNEHVVLLPMKKSAGRDDEEAEEREP